MKWSSFFAFIDDDVTSASIWVSDSTALATESTMFCVRRIRCVSLNRETIQIEMSMRMSENRVRCSTAWRCVCYASLDIYLFSFLFFTEGEDHARRSRIRSVCWLYAVGVFVCVFVNENSKTSDKTKWCVKLNFIRLMDSVGSLNYSGYCRNFEWWLAKMIRYTHHSIVHIRFRSKQSWCSLLNSQSLITRDMVYL